MMKNIVYLTRSQWEELIENGSVTVAGVTHTYDEDNDYRVSTDIEREVNAIQETIGDIQSLLSAI